MSQNTSLTTATTTDYQPTWKEGARLMLIKRIFLTLLITGVIAISAAATQAQSTSRRTWVRGNSVNSPVLTVPDQAADREPVAEMQTVSQELQTAAQVGLLDKKTAIVGSWLANGILVSFTSDGVVIGSGQGDVSLAPDLPTVTPQHGVWKYLGGRQFADTLVAVQYDVSTGEYRGLIKINGLLTLNETGDQFSANVKVQIFDADGNLVATFSFPGQGTRIKVEPFN